MNVRRVLLVCELGNEPGGALAALRRVAADVEALHVIAHAPGPGFHWVAGDTGEAGPLVDRLRRATAGAARSADLSLASMLDAGPIADLAARAGVELVVLDRPSPAALTAAGEIRKRLPLPILSVRSAPSAHGPLREIVCVAPGTRELGAVAAFLRDHGGAGLHATVLTPAQRLTTDLGAALDIAGIRASVTVRRALRPDRLTDLLVLARFPGRLLATGSWPAPVLVLPPVASPTPSRLALDVPDVVVDSAGLRIRLLVQSGPARLLPIPDQQVAIVARGAVAAIADSASGLAAFPTDVGRDAVGVYRVSHRRDADAVAAVEAPVRIIRPGSRPLVLFDSALSGRELKALARLGAKHATALLAVRLRPTRSCRALRARLEAAGLPGDVIDATAVLDEGAALDVGADLDGVRLARVAARLRGAGGYPVAAIVLRGTDRPQTVGFAALGPADVARWRAPRTAAAPASARARLDAATGAPRIAGCRVEVELDNTTARRWLLDAIAAARHRVHFQVYMAADDDIGRLVEAALAEAGSRGVRVRVVVDSLHALEGSLGARNPLLERLRGRPGVELRVLRPVTGRPSLDALKRRDHRKLVVVDGRVALVGGRNLSHEYYTGFDEVPLTPASTWRLVPWLDAGARVEGPAVAALEHSFLGAWVEAGGEPYRIETPPRAGSTGVRVVVHQGLRDARTLDAYLALIDGARSRLTAVNGFPLALELQHAMLRALRRGVRVRAVVGSLTPTHDGGPFGGPWSSARIAATSLVHSRIDALVAAGGEAWQFAVPPQPGWDPALGVIGPHVHAKLMTVDGQVCTVGSANLDITAGYWESELILVVEDPAIAAAVEGRIDRLLVHSKRFNPEDPTWRRSARRREWMRHWPGILSV